MRAIQCHRWGEPMDLVLVRDAAVPRPGPGEVLIKVRATGLNYADVVMIKGQYQTKPAFPFAPGLECAGVVDAVGPGVTRFKPGDEVIAKLDFGGFAEYAVGPEFDTYAKPPTMAWDVAASFYVAYVSSHVALKWQARLAPGEKLLVLGAAGGTGLTAVEIGKAMGATVFAAASSEEKLSVARTRGADHLINYATRPLNDQVLALTGDEGVDVVFDPVGGDLFDPALSSLGWGGRYLVFGFVGGIPQIPANRLLVKHRSAMGSSLRYFRDRARDKLRHSVEELFALWQAGKLAPFVSQRFPLERGAAAITELAERRATGRVVIIIDS
ncbi:MAG: NADPH:quinone oxidoreductase family protein [Alphaproteobacteria bacterium]|nr:NADPH:quinone oxidoreductase family protein [Alphaproteobacteria bacterium]